MSKKHRKTDFIGCSTKGNFCASVKLHKQPCCTWQLPKSDRFFSIKRVSMYQKEALLLFFITHLVHTREKKNKVIYNNKGKMFTRLIALKTRTRIPMT